MRNLLKLWALLVVCSLLLGAAGWEFGGYRVAILFLGSVVLLAAALYAYADRIIMGMLGARELVQAEAPALDSTLERLAAQAGVVKPRLYRLRRRLSARTLLRPRRRRRLGAGDLDRPPGRRVAGRARRRAGARTGPHQAPRHPAPDRCRRGRDRDRRVLADRRLPAARAPLRPRPVSSAAFVHLLLSPKREFDADRLAAELCGSPHGLADALVRLEQAMELVAFEASPATEPLYTTNPFAEEGLAALFVTHPPVGERVRRLRELDPDWREKLRAA